MKLIVITGTPGTGKSTIALKLKSALKKADLIRVNDVVKKKRLYSSKDKFGARIVKMALLKKELEKEIKRRRSEYLILEGHLLCEFSLPDAVVIVLREHLETVRERLIARGYPIEKIRDNLVSEATDYCGIMSRIKYREAHEFLGSDKRTMQSVIALSKGKKQKIRRIDLLKELLRLEKIDRRYVF